jgi:hypothetical protein
MREEGTMLETPAGRLKWERTGTGFRVEIPTSSGWLSVFFVIWLAIWTGTGLFGSIRISTGDELDLTTIIFATIWALAEVGVTVGLIWSLAGSTALTVDQSVVSIQRRIAGVEWDTRRFAARSVCNLRYIPSSWVRGWEGIHYIITKTESQIKFEADGKTRTLVSGITDIEAFALIDKMLDVDNFPKDRALEYIGKPNSG